MSLRNAAAAAKAVMRAFDTKVAALGVPDWDPKRDASDIQSPLGLVKHRHLDTGVEGGRVLYQRMNTLQSRRRDEVLRCKNGAEPRARKPLLLSFEPEPVFTLGRRQDDMAPEQEQVLTETLELEPMPRLTLEDLPTSYKPTVLKTLRGGLTTYHGPGQLLLWPVIDMHATLFPRFTTSTYAHCLERVTQRLLSECYGVETVTTEENPGVWIPDETGKPSRKIAAMGVHHKRYVTNLGLSLNVDITTQGSDTRKNPWARFAPCGLSSEGVTSLEREARPDKKPRIWNLEQIAQEWAVRFEEALLDVSKR